jgi:hypothetical protein
MKLLKEFLVTMFWVFAVMIVGFFVLNWLASQNLPFISPSATFIEHAAQAQG